MNPEVLKQYAPRPGRYPLLPELSPEAELALLVNHGVLVVAADIRQAHLRAVTLGWRARQAWEMLQAGEGEPMPTAIAESIGDMIDGNGFPFLWEAMARRELLRQPGLDTLGD